MVKIRDAHSLQGPLPEDGASLLARVPAAQAVSGAQHVAAALDGVEVGVYTLPVGELVEGQSTAVEAMPSTDHKP